MGWLDGYINRKRKPNYQGMTDTELDDFLNDAVQKAIREKNELRTIARQGNLNKHVIWHGGCVKCVAQKKHGVSYCFDCRYFDAEWDLPDKRIESYGTMTPPVDRVKIKILKHRNENKTKEHFDDKDFEI